MKMKTIAVILAAFPLAVSAQYEPVAEPAGVDGSRRSPWYIGFGLGTGDGSISGQGDTFTFDDLLGGTTSPTNAFMNFKVGATLSPGLLVGFDLSAVRTQVVEGGVMAAWQINNYDAAVTWFPQGEGFFVRGAAGLTALQFTVEGGGWNVRDTWSGYNVLAGVGYAFWLGQSFNLTVNADYSLQRYGKSSGDPESSQFWALWLGFDWY